MTPLHVPSHLDAAHADFSRALAWMDGAFMPLEEARISVRDLGLMYADMTYDVVHTWKGGFFRLDDHLDRFLTSCRGMRLDPGMDRAGLRGLLTELVRRTGLRDTLVYFACTRGIAPPGSRDPGLCRNTFFAHAKPLVLRGTPAQMQRGLNLKVSEDVHRIPASAVDPTLKNTHWGDFTRALFVAKDEGFDAVVLTTLEGLVAEGPGYNVMAMIGGALLSPDANVLEGISRKTMLEIAAQEGIPARLAPITPEELRNADEVFVTSTSCGLFPVTRIDGRVLGNGAPGPITARLLDRYYRNKDEGWMMTPVAGLSGDAL